jgi:hypothetical protein
MALDLVDFTATKRAAVRMRRAIDFAGEMQSGDALGGSPAVTAQDAAGTDVSGSLIGTVALSGSSKVVWIIKAWGTQGADYYIRVAVTTGQGDVLAKVVRLAIRGA